MAAWLSLSNDNVDSYCGHSFTANAGEILADFLSDSGGWTHNVTETHWLIIDLGANHHYVLTKMRGRSESGADPTNINIYFSMDKVTWGDAVVTEISTWQDTQNWQEVNMTSKKGRYIKIEIYETESIGAEDKWLYWGWINKSVRAFNAYGTKGITVSGQVKDADDNGVAGVLVALAGVEYTTTSTGLFSLDIYSLPLSGTLRATKTDCTFTPGIYTITNVSVDQSDKDFLAVGNTIFNVDPRLWLSEVDDFDNFEEGVKDADSFSLTIPATNEVKWIEALEVLFVGTNGEEWKVGSNELETPITPTNFTVKQQSNYGSRNIQSVKVNEQILFVDFVGRKVRELTYSDAVRKFVAPDLTALSEHITKSGIVSIAHQKNPDSILWCVLDDGSLLSMTYEREQNVVAWSKHPIDGTVQSVCVIPGTDEDEIWISVRRTINESDITYIEKMMPRNFGTDLDDAFFVDCGLTTTAPAASITLAHLVGETVAILADGVKMDTAVVGAGGTTAVKLDEVATNATIVQAGLPFTPKLEPLKPVINTQMGTTAASIVSAKEMGISLLNSAGVKYGVSDSDLHDIDLVDDVSLVNLSEIDGLFTGTVVVSVDGGFSLEAPLIISSDSPLPMTVRALIPKMDITGR